jgi:hypothetical protein
MQSSKCIVACLLKARIVKPANTRIARRQHGERVLPETAVMARNNRRAVEVVLPRCPAPGGEGTLEWDTWRHVTYINRSALCAVRAEVL